MQNPQTPVFLETLVEVKVRLEFKLRGASWWQADKGDRSDNEKESEVMKTLYYTGRPPARLFG
eukprot:374680-Pelagomonas_calceolata.AAC.1